MEGKEFVKLLVRDKKLLDYLIQTNYCVLKEDGDVLEDENGQFVIKEYDLPIETIQEKQSIINKIKNDDIVKNLTDIFQQNINNLSFRADLFKIDDYNDVFGIDDLFLNGPKYKPRDETYIEKCLVNKRFMGHVWTFRHPNFPNFIGIYGIRKSVLAYIIKEKDIIRMLLNAVKKEAEINNIKEIVIPWPLEDMAILLRKIGFTEYNTYEDNEYRKFLSYYATTSNYFIGNINLIN